MRNRVRAVLMSLGLVVASIALAAPATAATPQADPPSPGAVLANIRAAVPRTAYESIRSVGYTGQCVETPNQGNGQQLRIANCNSHDNQLWARIPIYAGATTYVFVNKLSGRCMDVRNSSLVVGKPVQQWDCTGGPGQQWSQVTPGVDVSMYKNVNSQFVLDTVAARNSGLMQWYQQGNGAQLWRI